MAARIVGAVYTRAIVGVAIAAAFVAVAGMATAQDTSSMLTYSRGQPVMPVYSGWHPNPDGTIDLWFSYLNNNWREETDIPVGPNNSVTGPAVPNSPDGGQPTHFLPRNNRYQFSIRIPNAQAVEQEEVIWTLTSHGKSFKAYATLKSQYVRDDEGLMREYFGETPQDGNEAPKLSIAGALTRTLKVGQPSELTIVATDDGKPAVGSRPARPGVSSRFTGRASVCGDITDPFFCGVPTESGSQLAAVRGFRMGCFLFRGDPAITISSREDFGQATLIAFDPPQEKAWEDHRGTSPWGPGYQLPPIPKDNTWHINTTFMNPGTYVVRCQAHDGLLATNQNVTFKVVE